MPRSPEVAELIRRMRVSHENCLTRELDLPTYRFRSTDTALWLEPVGAVLGIDKLYFRFDPSRPKDTDIHLGRDQFCKVLKIPTAFFRDNRPSLQETFVRNWFSVLTPGDKKSLFQFRLRQGAEMTAIRALLSKDETDMPHHKVLSALLPECEDAIDMLESSGDTQDARMLEAKFLIGPEITIAGEPYRLGLYLQASELGVSNLIVDAFLYHLPTESTFVITFDRDSVLSIGYNGTQPKDMETLLLGVVPDLQALVPEIIQRVEASHSYGFSGIKSTLAHFTSFLPKDILEKLRREVEGSFHTVGSDGEDTELQEQDHPWWGVKGFTLGMSGVAKGLTGGKRRMLEKQAGYLLDLKFPKK